MVAIEIQHAAATAFDSVAPRYDELFTSTPVGRFQRMVIWKQAVKAFRPGSRVLELNCGTGQDAIFLARSGIVVTACDASPEMIKQARIRKERSQMSAYKTWIPSPLSMVFFLTSQASIVSQICPPSSINLR
jgi:ubiquinone/menaquinone biosynthesis C-methylase UbiE